MDCDHPTIIRQLDNALPAQDMIDSPLQLLLTPGDYGHTDAHYAAIEDNYQEMESMLDSLTDSEECLQLLMSRDRLGFTVLHTAVLYNRIQAVRSIEKYMTVDHMYQLMKAKETDFSCTALHYATFDDNTDMISTLMDPLTDEQRLDLLEMREEYGHTAKDKAVRERYTQAADLLEDITTTSMVRIITTTTDQDGKQRLLERLRLNQPLSTQQIQELYPHSDRYVIPRNQKVMRQHAFILYNKDDRPGADEEASNLSGALEEAGCVVIKQTWSCVRELQKMIVDGLEPIRSSCSFIMVCLMSHGSMGRLQGKDEEEIAINTILKLLSENLPGHVPLVLLIQACQGSRYGITLPPTCSADPAVYGAGVSNEDRKVVVTRPHTLLLQASLTGEPAYRGKYTGAVAAQIKLADDKMTLYNMEMEARRQMETAHNVSQIPTTMSTLMRHLILPGKYKEVESEYELSEYEFDFDSELEETDTDSDIDSDMDTNMYSEPEESEDQS